MKKARPRKRKKATQRFQRFRSLASGRALRSRLLWGSVALLLLAQLESFVWLGAMTAELRLPLMLLSLLAAAVVFARREALLGGCLLGSAVLWGLPLWPYLRGMRPTPGHGPSLRVVQQDAANEPLSAHALAAWLAGRRADVVSLTGLREADVARARKWATGYTPLPDAADEESLLLTKTALRPHETQAPDHVHIGRCAVQITQLNLPAIFRPDALAKRTQALARVGSGRGLSRRVYVGRFGSRSAAADLAAFRRAAQVRDVRVGHGLLATAPGALGALGLPLDQILVHGWLLVRETSVEAPVGPGMHRALATTLELTERRCAR